MAELRDPPEWLARQVPKGSAIIEWTLDRWGFAVALERTATGFAISEYAPSKACVRPQRTRAYERWEYSPAYQRFLRESEDWPLYVPEGTPPWWEFVESLEIVPA